jgi:hypothetical protein
VEVVVGNTLCFSKVVETLNLDDLEINWQALDLDLEVNPSYSQMTERGSSLIPSFFTSLLVDMLLERIWYNPRKVEADLRPPVDVSGKHCTW